MSSKRSRIVDELKTIWNRREMPAIPDHELRKMDNDTLGYLLRFWNYQDRNWDKTLGLKPFRELPPKGANFADLVTVRLKPATRDELPKRFERGTPRGRTFATGGGVLTPRQVSKFVGTPLFS